jgi:hypothetical protein
MFPPALFCRNYRKIDMKAIENHKEEESNTRPDNLPASSKLPSPKRGAFPTPKAEIEKATPYIPEAEPTTISPPAEPISLVNDLEGGKNSR